MSEFNPQLSKARMQQAGVVDETAGMAGKLAGNLVKEAGVAYSQEQVRQFNNEVNEVLKDNTQQEVDPNREKILAETNDDIEQELLKQRQGIINKNQMEMNIRAKAAKRKASAVFHSQEIDAIVDNALGKINTGNYAKRAKDNMQNITEQVRIDRAKQREEMSFDLFQKSSLDITPEQKELLTRIEDTKAKELMIKANNNLSFEINRGQKLSQEERELNEKNINRTSSMILRENLSDELDVLDMNIKNSVGKDESYFNAAIANYQRRGAASVNDYIKSSIRFGVQPDQTVIDNMNKTINSNVQMYQEYKKFTKDSMEEVDLKSYLLASQVRNEIKKETGQDLSNLKERIRMANDPVLTDIRLSPDKQRQKTQAQFLNERLYNKYLNDEGQFDGDGFVKELMKSTEINNSELEKEYGTNYAKSVNKTIASMDMFGIDKATMTLLTGEDKDPQTTAIQYNQQKQNETMDQIINTQKNDTLEAKQFMNQVGNFLRSNLQMLNSDKYSYGPSGTQVSSSRQSNVVNTFSSAGGKIYEIINNDPDVVSIDENGEVFLNTENGNNLLKEFYIAAQKLQDPISKKAMADKIAEVKSTALQTNVINPMIEAAKKELNSNPIYNNLTDAQKNEVINKVVSNNRDIQMVQAAKDMQIEKTNQLLKELGGTNTTYGGSYYKTLSGNFDKVMRGNTLEKLSGAAYFFGSVDNGIKSVVNDVTKFTKSLFADDIEEQVTQAAVDKKLGLKRAQARIVRALMDKQTPFEEAKKGYEVISEGMESLKNKALIGDDLTDAEETRMRYYDKYIKAYNKNYDKEIKKEIKLEKEKPIEIKDDFAEDLFEKEEPTVEETVINELDVEEPIEIRDDFARDLFTEEETEEQLNEI